MRNLICDAVLLVGFIGISLGRQIQWNAQLVEYDEKLIRSTSINAPVAVSMASPNTLYALQVNLKFKDDDSLCSNCAQELSNIGGYPRFIYDPLTVKGLNDTLIQQYAVPKIDPTTNSWFLPFPTLDEGLLVFKISSIGFSSPTLDKLALNDAKISVPIHWHSVRQGESSYMSVLGDISAIIPPSKSYNPSSFSFHFMPYRSALWIGVFSSNFTSSAIVTGNEFSSIKNLRFDFPASTYSNADLCTSPSAITSPAVYKAHLRQHSILAHTPGGIIYGSNSESRIVWKNVLAGCVSLMTTHTQAGTFNESNCSPTYAITKSGNVWRMSEMEAVFSELVDKSTGSFKDSFGLRPGSFDVVYADTSSTSCDRVELLANNGLDVAQVLGSSAANLTNTYWLARFDQSNLKWNLIFVLPPFLPNRLLSLTQGRIYDERDSSNRKFVNGYMNDVTASKFALKITGMTYGRSVGRDAFMWGNVLLYSPDAFDSVYMLHPSPNTASPFTPTENITSFTSSGTEAFAFISASLLYHEVHYGQIGSSQIIIVRKMNAAAGKDFQVFFDQEDRLYLLEVNVNQVTGAVSITREALDVREVLDFVEMSGKLTCPYKSLKFTAPLSPLYTRNLLQESATLPDQIFLDHGYRYTFTVDVERNDDWKMEDIKLSVSISSAEWLQFQMTKTLQPGGKVVSYEIAVYDTNSLRGQSSPGATLEPTTLKLSFANSNLACREYAGENNLQTVATHHIIFYTGCPPYQYVSLNKTGLPSNFCPDGNLQPDILCLFYEADFHPNFILNDVATKKAIAFEENYTIRVVGGGPSLKEMANYSPDAIAKLNPLEKLNGSSTSLVWMALNDKWYKNIPVFRGKDNIISFICNPKSPCYGVKPKSGQPPDFYFLMEMSTETVNEETSFCNLKTYFVIRIFGLPLEFQDSVVITASSVGAGLLVAVLFAFYFRIRDEGRLKLEENFE